MLAPAGFVSKYSILVIQQKTAKSTTGSGCAIVASIFRTSPDKNVDSCEERFLMYYILSSSA
jgi:hypothetical protein